MNIVSSRQDFLPLQLPKDATDTAVPAGLHLADAALLAFNLELHDLRGDAPLVGAAEMAGLVQWLQALPADTAAATGIKVAADPVKEHLRGTLPYAGYGQGEVVSTPLRLARVAGAIAADGVIRDGGTLRRNSSPQAASDGVRWLTPEQASFLATSMRDVVLQGTGRVLASHPVHIAGKTGTAEVGNAPSHSWFVGFAPYATRARRIAFAVIVENAGYGGRVAAPLAGDVVSAAKATGVIQ